MDDVYTLSYWQKDEWGQWEQVCHQLTGSEARKLMDGKSDLSEYAKGYAYNVALTKGAPATKFEPREHTAITPARPNRISQKKRRKLARQRQH